MTTRAKSQRLPGPRRPSTVARYARLFSHEPDRALAALHDAYGPVSSLGVRPFRYTFLLSREANEYLLATDPGNFRWREAFASLLPISGETALVVSDGDDHRRRRRLVQPAFHVQRIQHTLRLMVEEANKVLDGWTVGEAVDAYQAFRGCVRTTLARTLFGESFTAFSDDLGRYLQPGLDFVSLPPMRQWKIDLPWTAYHRAMGGRRRADELLYREIRHHRERTSSETEEMGYDILSSLVEAVDDEGNRLSDAEVRDQLVGLINGNDTTSATIGWAIRALLTEPGAWDRAQVEIATLGDQELSVENLHDLRYLDGVVSEALRLWPPVVVAGRMPIEPFELHGYTIPAGTLVLYSPYVTHRLPSLWRDPDRFDPLRWDPRQPGYEEPAPYSYVPFGGGYRRCIGFGWAIQAIKVALVALLRRTRLDLLTPDVHPRGLASFAPSDGVVVRVTGRAPNGETLLAEQPT